MTGYGKIDIMRRPTKRPTKRVVWLNDSKPNMDALPSLVRSSFGHLLWEVQVGALPENAKPLFSLSKGVYELRENFDTNTYRLMYIACLEKAIYVLDVFMKKSTTGIGLPQRDAERIKERAQRARRMDEEN